MNLRLMTTAFIFKDSRILMLKRSLDRKLAPGLWTGVGGHLEPNEIRDPKIACLREIYEETGINENEIKSIKLRYILLRQKGMELRQQFVYICETYKEEVINTEEGQLHWIEIDELQELIKPKIIEFMLQHYIEYGNQNNVYVGTMIDELSAPSMRWIELTDPGDV